MLENGEERPCDRNATRKVTFGTGKCICSRGGFKEEPGNGRQENGQLNSIIPSL